VLINLSVYHLLNDAVIISGNVQSNDGIIIE
jgi:hypothetical protein